MSLKKTLKFPLLWNPVLIFLYGSHVGNWSSKLRYECAADLTHFEVLMRHYEVPISTIAAVWVFGEREEEGHNLPKTQWCLQLDKGLWPERCQGCYTRPRSLPWTQPSTRLASYVSPSFTSRSFLFILSPLSCPFLSVFFLPLKNLNSILVTN